MPQLVDPRTGDVYDVAEEDAEGEQKKHGLVSPDQYTAQQESPVMAAARVGAAATLALPAAMDRILPEGLRAPQTPEEIAKQSPDAQKFFRQSAADQSKFFERAALAKKAHPIAALAGEAIPYGLEGALGGAVGSGLAGGGLAGAAAGLGTESAVTGVSQEAVDAVSANGGKGRDFSAKTALMNGGVNAIFGGLLMGAGHALSGGAGRVAGELAGEAAGSEAGAVSGVRPTEGVPGARDILSEIDPGQVPEAVQGGRQRAPQIAESAGAAASNFDELPAAQAMTEIKDGKGVDTHQLAEAAPAIRDHLSLETEQSFNAVDDIVRNDATIGAKHEDFAQGAAEWTPEIVQAQDKWVEGASNKGLALADELAATKHAGGLGESAKTEIMKGIERVQDAASGVERNVALDNMKRGVDRLAKRFGNYGNSAVDEVTRQGLIDKLLGYSDELRDGLKSPELFGRNGPLQEAQNKAYVDLIDPLSRVQKDVFQVTGRDIRKVGVGAPEMRANPDKILGIMSDPRLGGELFKRDLQASLDAAEDLARARQEHGLSKLERLPELIQHLQAIRDDMNTAQVLHVAEGVAGGPGHAGAGVSGGAALGANVLVHAAEFGGRAVGFPLGGVVRASGAMGKVARGLDKLKGAFGIESELAKPGTATRALLDRYAARIKGGAALADDQRQALMPEGLKKFLDGTYAPPPRVPPVTPGAAGTGTPQAPPGAPANDIQGKVAGVAALAGGGALLASGQAQAAMLPEQQAARDELSQHLATLPPDQQAATLRSADSFARIQQRTEQRVQGAVKDLFALAKDPKAPPRYQSPQARKIDQRSQELDVPRHLARFMGKHDDPVDAYREKSALVTSVVADPSKLAAHMAQNLGDLPQHQPEIFASMVGQTMATVEYLHGVMPVSSGRSALDPKGYPPTFEEISDWAGHWVGAVHPLDSLDDLASNQLVPQQVDAVQALWPEGYQMFQTAAMGQIHELSQKNGVIPRAALEQIDSALNLDGAGEPTLSSAFAGLLKQAEQADAQKMQAQASKPQPPMQSQSPSRLASSSLGSLHQESA